MSLLVSLAKKSLPSWAASYWLRKRSKRRTSALIASLAREFPEHRLRVLDIGARFGIDENSVLRRIREYPGLYLVGIEPDKAEADRLSAGVNGPYAKVLPVAVGRKVESRTLYLTRHAGCSSILRPADRSLSAYSGRDCFDVVGTMPIETTTVDELFPEDEAFDIVKIDVQGVEDEVLEGGSRIIGNAIGITLEAQTTEVYEGQALFPKIHERLLKLGFRLIQLAGGVGLYDGEVVEVDCGYIRQLPSSPCRDELVNRLLFACLYDNAAYCQLLLREGGVAAFGSATALRIAHAAGISLDRPRSAMC